jgi:phage terminase large subunit-like protein
VPQGNGAFATHMSAMEELSRLAPDEIEDVLSTYSAEEVQAMLYQWELWARPKQIEPIGSWFVWLLLSGRGFGKSRVGAEWVRKRVENGKGKRIALIAETAADARDVMIEGESGLMTISPPWFKPVYEPSKRRLTWPNGAVAITFSGEEPDQLRGPQFDTAWVDELAKYMYPQDTWDNLEFGLRLGDDPRACVTTTPRPIQIIRDMIEDPMVKVTTGSTYENLSNLAATFIKRVVKKYEGTRLGRQELHAEVLTDTPGALWSYDLIESTREKFRPSELVRIVVAVDPAVTNTEESDETGIVVCGKDARGHGYVLKDKSGRYSPGEWGRVAVALYHEFQADRIVGENNQGGDMVEHVVKTTDSTVSYRGVSASRGKIARAEPVAALMEQGKIHHVGQFAQLEDQMTSYTGERKKGEPSPDRMDAMVWGMFDLLLKGLQEYNGRQFPAVRR